MTSTAHGWRRTLLKRGAAAGLAVLSLTVYSLLAGGGSQLALRPTAATPVGTESSLAVSEAVSPTNGSINVAAMGPNHSLRFYWQVGGTWYGPLGLGGANTTYSAPSIVAQDNGNFDIAVEGPNHTLYEYWDASGTWYGPYGVGAAGTTYSTPSMAIEVVNDRNIDIVAEGPGNTLYQWWNTQADAQWHGPLAVTGAQTDFSAPSLTASSFNSSGQCGSGHCNELFVTNIGVNNDVMQSVYQQDTNAWGTTTGSNEGTGFSAPSQTFDYSVFEGPNHSLYQAYGQYLFGGIQLTQLTPSGTVFSAPSIEGRGDSVAWEGPSHTLYYQYYQNNGDHLVGVGGPGSTFSAPAITTESSGTIDFVAEGPNNSLYAYWNDHGVYHGPVQVAGAGTTFASSN